MFSVTQGEWEWEGEVGLYESAAGMYGRHHGGSFLTVSQQSTWMWETLTSRRHAGFSRSAPLPSSHPAPSSHPPSNPGAKSFLITFDTVAQAEAALVPTKGFLMQPGWEMTVSLE